MTASPKAAASLPKAGDLIANKYRVERMIGAGGMGAVYVAVHELLRERVAIKVLLPEVVSDRDAVTRFINEARNATRIRNEHVAQVKDVDTLPSGAPYMIMDFLEGHDLGQCQKVWGPVPIAPAVDYILQTLEALAEAHAIGVIHRDLKPANLFLTKTSDGSDCIKVLDFGISKSTDLTAPLADGGGVTSTKSVLGSPGYMSPEQIKNARNVDARADIWSIGVILYKLLTNHKPFNGDTMGEVFAAIFEETPKPIRQHRPDVPPALEHIVISGCLQRNRDQRFRNVAELAVALAPYGLPTSNQSVERIRRRLDAKDRADKSVSQQSAMAGTMNLGGQADPSQASQSHASQSHGSQSYASQSQPSQASQSYASQSQASTSQSHSSTSQSHSSQSQHSQGTAAPWAQPDGVPQQGGGKGWMIAVAVVLGLLVMGGGALAAKTFLDKGSAGPKEDPSATATQTGAKPPPTMTTAATTTTGAPSDSALSIDALPTVKPTATATATATATTDATTKSTATSKPTSTTKSTASAPSDDVLKMRR